MLRDNTKLAISKFLLQGSTISVAIHDFLKNMKAFFSGVHATLKAAVGWSVGLSVHW